MSRPTFFKVSAGLILSGMTCWLSYHLLGASVDGDGTLNEPFGLIPVGWLLVVLGIMAGGIGIVKK